MNVYTTQKLFTSRSFATILSLWLFVSIFNFFKPVHIDDPVYLYGARAVTANPFLPYGTDTTDIRSSYQGLSSIAQPPLIFYGSAFIFKFFGESELALHVFHSLYSLLSIICFFILLKYHNSNHALFATALFCISPAFLPSQNLMTDVPLLSFALLFFVFLQRGIFESSTRQTVFAGIAACAACFMKYPGASMFPIYFLALCTNCSLKKICVSLCLPLVLISAWCIFSYAAYGTVHMIKPNLTGAGSSFWLNATNWLVCLGAVCPFSFLFLRGWFENRFSAFLLGACTLGAAFYFPSSLVGDPQYPSLKYLLICFWSNGLFTALSVMHELGNTAFRSKGSHFQSFILWIFCWFLLGFLFICFFAKFPAVRHILFIYPVVILALSIRSLHGSITRRMVAFGLSATLGILLAISDIHYAAVYKNTAKELAERYKTHPQLWAVGPWGWHWYAEKNGMKGYVLETELQNNDIVIQPDTTCCQKLNPKHMENLHQLERIIVNPTPFTWLRTMAGKPRGGYYVSSGKAPPWRISFEPLDIFTVYEFKDIPK